MQKYSIRMVGVLLGLLLLSCEKSKDPVDPVDTQPELTIFDVSLERDSAATSVMKFFINISRAGDKTINLQYNTNAGSAVPYVDFIPKTGSLQLEAGKTLGVIEIEIPGSKVFAPDLTFELQVFNVSNAKLIGTGKVVGTIMSPKYLQPVDPTGYTTPLAYAGYQLAWHDEFETSINLNDWGYDLGAGGWGNNELENYTSSSANSYISNGALVIEARREPNGEYTSARMLTKGKKSFKFGRIDIRAKLPKGKGIWPALWMLGSDIGTVGWPACGEIDIMELIGDKPSTIHGTAHWGAQGSGSSISSTSITSLSSGDFSEKFHVFSIIWEQNKIRWLLDDQQYHSINPTTTGGAANYLFNKEFFFIFNVAVGGDWPGNPNASTQFPQRMLVDYIRVFQ